MAKYNELMAYVYRADTEEVLKRMFEQRIKAHTPIDPDTVFVLNYLLYFNDPKAPLFLANLLLNFVPEERLLIHNWIIHSESQTLVQEQLGKGIEHLEYPLFPTENLLDTNRSLCKEAMAKANAKVVEGAGPLRHPVEAPTTERVFKTGKRAQPLVGGGPQTNVPVYSEGSANPVAYADTTQISDGMAALAMEMGRLSELNTSLKKQITALERRSKEGRPAQAPAFNSGNGKGNGNGYGNGNRNPVVYVGGCHFGGHRGCRCRCGRRGPVRGVTPCFDAPVQRSAF